MDSKETSFRDKVFEITKNHGADVILDTIGSDFKEQVLRCIARRGRILIVGFAGGEIPEIPAHYILNKFCSVIGVSWGFSFFQKEPENYRRIFEAVVAMYEARKIKPYIAKAVSLSAASEAMGDLIANRHDGRAVIGMDLAIFGMVPPI